MMHSPTNKEQSILPPKHITCAPIVGLYLTLIQLKPLSAYTPSTISLNLLLCSSLIAISLHSNPLITIWYISSTLRLPSLNPIVISLSVFILYISSALPFRKEGGLIVHRKVIRLNLQNLTKRLHTPLASLRLLSATLRYLSLRIFSALSVDSVYTRACMRARTSSASALAVGRPLSALSSLSFLYLFLFFRKGLRKTLSLLSCFLFCLFSLLSLCFASLRISAVSLSLSISRKRYVISLSERD